MVARVKLRPVDQMRKTYTLTALFRDEDKLRFTEPLPPAGATPKASSCSATRNFIYCYAI